MKSKRRGRARSRSGAASGRIKDLIHRKSETYVSLAEEIGITPQAVSEIVNGRTKGRTARYALAKALGLDVRDLWPAARSRQKHARRKATVPRRRPRRRR